jgi:hypothetical protein
MLWLGVSGRRKIADLEERLERVEKAFRTLDLDVTNQIDRLTGLAKRYTGRLGGRPPAKQDGEAPPQSEDGLPTTGALFSRHVL